MVTTVITALNGKSCGILKSLSRKLHWPITPLPCERIFPADRFYFLVILAQLQKIASAIRLITHLFVATNIFANLN
jgi:hypothetical protein